MAKQKLGVTVTYKAGEDMDEEQYYLVKLSAADTVSLCGGNEKAIGVLQNAPEDGEEAVVAITGISKFVGAEGIAVGKAVTSTTAGKGEVADSAGEWCVGVCTEATSNDGDVGALRIGPFTAHADDS